MRGESSRKVICLISPLCSVKELGVKCQSFGWRCGVWFWFGNDSLEIVFVEESKGGWAGWGVLKVS
jgi:hypothetical protein